jgi:hypothetical protein
MPRFVDSLLYIVFALLALTGLIGHPQALVINGNQRHRRGQAGVWPAKQYPPNVIKLRFLVDSAPGGGNM